MLLEGERLVKSPTVVKRFLESLPVYDVPAKYVLMKPLSQVQEDEAVQTVTFMAKADQISALYILANYHAGTVPTAWWSPLVQPGARRWWCAPTENPGSSSSRALIGLTDIMARRMTRKLLEKDRLTFSVPFELSREMEDNVFGKLPGAKGMKGSERLQTA